MKKIKILNNLDGEGVSLFKFLGFLKKKMINFNRGPYFGKF
jgi:hypothetical protein